MVFDGHGGMSSDDTTTVVGGVKVIYSAINKKADDVIKEIIYKNRGTAFIVISSDREIVKAAWASSSVPIPSEMFLRKLEEVLGIFDEYADEYETVEIKKTGGLSKKKKAIIRALRRL